MLKHRSGPRSCNSYKIRVMLMRLVGAPHFRMTRLRAQGLLPNPLPLRQCPPRPLRGAAEGLRALPSTRQWNAQAAARSPAQGLSQAEPLPWGGCPERHRPAQSPQGQFCRVVPEPHSLRTTAQWTLWPGWDLQSPHRPWPTCLPGLISPTPAQGCAGARGGGGGLLQRLWGLLRLPSSAGWLDTRRRGPRRAPSRLLGRPRPWSKAEVGLRARKEAGVSSSRCQPVLTRLCPHTCRNANYSCGCLTTLRGLSNSQGGKDRVSFSLTIPPQGAQQSPGIYRGLEPVEEWLRMKPRPTLASQRKM